MVVQDALSRRLVLGDGGGQRPRPGIAQPHHFQDRRHVGFAALADETFTHVEAYVGLVPVEPTRQVAVALVSVDFVTALDERRGVRFGGLRAVQFSQDVGRRAGRHVAGVVVDVDEEGDAQCAARAEKGFVFRGIGRRNLVCGPGSLCGAVGVYAVNRNGKWCAC